MNLTQRKRFYQTVEWRAMSRFIRARDGWLCTECRPRTVAAALVHHKVPLSEGGAPLEESNLTSLCKSCHREFHGQVIDKKRVEWSIYIRSLMGEG